MFALEFPPISHVVEWPNFIGGPDACSASTRSSSSSSCRRSSPSASSCLGARKKALVPTGIQNVAESAVDFVEDEIVMQTMGKEGLKYTPFLMTLMFFIFVCNILEIIPVIQMPVNARIALPMFLALLVYVIYHGVGSQGARLGYFKNALVPPGVPLPCSSSWSRSSSSRSSWSGRFSHVGPSLRQHAGRPPPPRDLRRAHQRPLRPSSGTRSSAAAGLRRRLPHRLRDPGRVPPGLHLHDPRPPCTSAAP